jgi:hypothetical protein
MAADFERDALLLENRELKRRIREYQDELCAKGEMLYRRDNEILALKNELADRSRVLNEVTTQRDESDRLLRAGLLIAVQSGLGPEEPLDSRKHGRQGLRWITWARQVRDLIGSA